MRKNLQPRDIPLIDQLKCYIRLCANVATNPDALHDLNVRKLVEITYYSIIFNVFSKECLFISKSAFKFKI
jgi:hypothetical protein